MKLFRSKTEQKPERVVPRHVAIIMDGNGRWAQKRGMPRQSGHAAGSETFRRIATYCRDVGMEYLTVYAFSTENWKRSSDEITAIMGLMKKYLLESIEEMAADRIKLRFFGDLAPISPELLELIERTNEISEAYEGFQVNCCFNYGGRDEILHAARAFAKKCAAGEASPEELTEASFAGGLYSAGIPDPDLVIRTGGELRISNFLLWQSAYAEYYFTDVLWPDFSPQELEKAFAAFAARNRRYGGVNP